MNKLIGIPALAIGLPQAVLFGFWRFMSWALQPTPGNAEGFKAAYGFAACIVLFSACAWTLLWLNDDGVPDYRREQERLAKRREQAEAELEAAIGIPRIPASRK